MLLFLYGEDSFRSGEKLAGIKNKFLQKDKIGSGLSIVDFEENGEEANLPEIAGARGLFSVKRLVIAKNLILSGTAGNQSEALNFLESNKKNLQASQDLVLVFWEKGLPRKNNKLFKFLLANSKSQNFEKLSGGKLSAWILKRVQSLGGKISLPALNKLAAYVGSDLFQMDNEIEKLVNYVSPSEKGLSAGEAKVESGEKNGIITETDIDLLVKSKIKANIFETIDALASKDKKKALELLHNQLEKGDDPFYIFSMYVYQFRNLLKIGGFFAQGAAPAGGQGSASGRYFQGNTNQYEIAKLAKLHPFVAQKGIAQLRGFTLAQLKKIYKKLGEIDFQIKTGKVDIILALDKFVVGI
ncbi:DNA polymerase III subunit delta [bacterium]|nr:DNA polymerase III subunit delta [bacterium]